MSRAVFCFVCLVWLASGAARAADPAIPIGGDPSVDPDDFIVTEFASGLDFPIGMVALPDGSLLVGLNRSAGAGSSLLNSDGELVRFVDANFNGVADDAGSVLASGIGAITSVARAGDLVFAATGAIGAPAIHVFRAGAAASDPLVSLGSLSFALPLPWSHLTFGIAARERPGAVGVYELIFNLGSRNNLTPTTDLVPVSGLFSASLEADTHYRAVIDDTGPSIAVTAIEPVARGLRNAFGSAFDPETGDLYVSENGMDGASGAAINADELNRIASDQQGDPVEDFGFPSHYVEYGTGTIVGSGALLPEVAFQPLPGGGESRGPADVELAPARFPEALRGGLFAAFHGSAPSGPGSNSTNPLVFVDLDTGHYFHFIAPGTAGVGYLDGLASSWDTLFVADLSADSSLGAYGTGVIYAIRARSTLCDDGRDNDHDGKVDFQGWDANGDGDLDDPGDFPRDGGCAGFNDNREKCGLGAELALVLSPILAVGRWRRRRLTG